MSCTIIIYVHTIKSPENAPNSSSYNLHIKFCIVWILNELDNKKLDAVRHDFAVAKQKNTIKLKPLR